MINRLCKIYILCSERIEYLRQSFESVSSQNFGLYEIIISDNSSSKKIKNFFDETKKNTHKKYFYVKRFGERSFSAHLKKIIKEVRSEFCVFFHDDDVMHPNYLEILSRTLSKNKRYSAVGCNAIIVNENTSSLKKFADWESDIEIKTPEELLNFYFSNTLKITPAPFPSYLYRSEAFKLVCCQSLKGKNCDLIFLLELLKFGPILWLNKPLISLRLHGKNETKKESVISRAQLLKYIYEHSLLKRRSKIVMKYKSMYFKNYLKSKINSFNFIRKNKFRFLFLIYFIIINSL
jgi:glycosyltransferase involved in cell wall biosynthesis